MNRMQKTGKYKGKGMGRRILAGLLAGLLCLGAGAALAAEGQDNCVAPGTLAYARQVPAGDGSWLSSTKNRPSAIGEREAMTLPLLLDGKIADGESLIVSVDSNSLDMTSAELILLIEPAGAPLGKELAFQTVKNTAALGGVKLRTEIKVDSLWRKGTPRVSLLLLATRTAEGGSVHFELRSKKIHVLESDSVLRVEGYAIRKQGGGAATIEAPVGLSGMSNVSTIYVIAAGDHEMMRVMMKDGMVLGLGIREGGVISGIEFDVSRKVYVSSISGRQVASREEMQNMFNALNFSFLRAPDESEWIQRQSLYSFTRTFDF